MLPKLMLQGFIEKKVIKTKKTKKTKKILIYHHKFMRTIITYSVIRNTAEKNRKKIYHKEISKKN